MDIAQQLRAVRSLKGLSQRDVSEMTGIPQAQISRIESGAVDLRLSTLVELSRALGHELTLVPRAALPAVRGIASGATPDRPQRSHRLDDDG